MTKGIIYKGESLIAAPRPLMGGVVFTFSANHTLTIDNVTKAQLTAADFIL